MSKDTNKPYEGALMGDAHYFAVRVYFEDTDLGGVVYHANYLRFLERARSDLLRALGIDQRAAFEQGEGIYAVTEMHIKYARPAKFDDELVIVSRVNALRRASCVVDQKIMRAHERVVEATVTVAFLTPEGRPTRQPADWLDKFELLKAKPR
jgi:acyl-CoA thioester hydrolase